MTEHAELDAEAEALARDEMIYAEMCKPERVAKFWSRIAPGPGECQDWTMAKNPNGYGVFRIGFQCLSFTCSAHRVAWMLSNGRAVPAGMEVDHTCRPALMLRPDPSGSRRAARERRPVVRSLPRDAG